MAERVCHGRGTLPADQIPVFQQFFKCQLHRAPRDPELSGKFACGGNPHGTSGVMVDQIHHIESDPHLLGHGVVCLLHKNPFC